MLFNSVEFLAFFAVVYGLYLVLSRRGQNALILIASYIFYGFWDWKFLGLIALSTTVDFVVARAMEDAATPALKRRILYVSLAFNLGLLATFKYAGFFARSFMDAFAALGYTVDLRFAELVLPVGISFYTFQSLSYTIDVYRGHVKAARDPLDFAMFVAFFPQLVAGPIERGAHFLPQVQSPRVVSFECLREGGWLILFGYFKKVVLADNMVPFTTRLFQQPGDAHGLEVLFGIYAFAFQIYGDFSGYTDIARGTAKLLGFDLLYNFKMPYFAVNPSDFWRRWHISLSTWLRDYLYIPLGGSKGSAWLTYRNLMITMVLGGLWHGASYNFVAWGVFHGAILCIHRWLTGRRGAPPNEAVTPLRVLGFFHVTCLGWLLFGVQHLGDAWRLLGNLFLRFELNGWLSLASVVAFATPVVLLDWLQLSRSNMLVIKSYPTPVRLGVYGALLSGILLCGSTGAKQFIYFQF